jgi:DMSO/TMAO reductase YedYZ molybdopterin-dependent catalytic subunit
MWNRRQFMIDLAKGFAAIGAGALRPGIVLAAEAAAWRTPGLPSGTLDSSVLDALPGKRPLVKRTYRPANYEAPIEYLTDAFTPNDAFFVRYHLPNIPELSTAEWKLQVAGDSVERPLTVDWRSLTRDYEPVELAALCMCSGNRRGFSEPHVPGVQWGHGAMGNALWKGVRLKDVLARAGVRKDALEVVFDGAESPVLNTTPDFVKCLPMWKALDENTLLAFEMNGAPLPHWNGHPVRLVVPGWTATYWMKQIISIRVVPRPFDGFWMKSAYRIPKGKFPIIDRFISQESETTTPITEMVVSSLITNLRNGQAVRLGQRLEVKGIAWDGGYGIQTVEVSTDGGRIWRAAELGRDLGRFSWRQWSHAFKADRRGVQPVMAKATNRMGASQTFNLIFNPAGYHNNVVQRIDLQVA